MRLRNLILAIAVLSGVAFAQGGHVDLPAMFSQSSSPMQISGLNIVVCLSTATVTNGQCSPTVSTFSDQALTQPITNLQTNGDGLFPFWISPGTYQYCASGAPITSFCNPFTVGVAPGSSPSFLSLILPEGTAPSGVTGKDILYADSSLHRPRWINNNGSVTSDALLSDNLGAFAATTSAQLAAVVSDESGTGPLVFANGPVIASQSENGLAILHADQYANWSAIQTACIAAGGCTVDARSFISPLAMGTIDSGATVEHIWLAPIIVFTLDHVVVRSGFEMSGMGIENIQGTKIQAVGAANQAPFIMPASGSPQSVQGVILRDFELEATVGNTAQDGLFFDVSSGNLPAGSNLESSTFERITFNSFKGSARHLKGRTDTPSSVIQFNNFIQNNEIIPSGNTTVGAALRIEGTVGQNFFWNDILGETTVSGSTTAYLGVTSAGDAAGPYSNWFYGPTIQGGDTGVIVNGCQACTFRDTHAEADKTLFLVKTPTTWHNNKLLLDGGVANGNVGVNSGAGRIVDASDSSNTFGNTVELANWAIEGTPDKIATCNNGTNVIIHDISFDQATPSMITTGCTPGYSTSSTTLNTVNSHYAFVNGCSGGTVTTLTSGLGVNEVLALYFNAACTFAVGGNIQLTTGYPGTLAFNVGEQATFINGDQGGSNAWILLNTTAARANGYFSSPGRTTLLGSTTVYTTGATDGLYILTLHAVCKTQVAAATVTPALSYTDPSGTVQTATLTAATCTTLGSASQTVATTGLEIKGGTNVSISAAISGSPNYDIRSGIVKMGGN